MPKVIKFITERVPKGFWCNGKLEDGQILMVLNYLI